MSNWFADQIGALAGDAVYYLGGGKAEEAQGQQLDAKLQALNNDEYGAGGRVYNEIQDQKGTDAAVQAYQAVQADMASGATGDVLDQLQEAGKEGADQGKKDFWSWILNLITSAIGLIPWWVWLAAGVGIFFWMGGFKLLKGKLAR
jgi:hypothetical protein